MKKRLNRKCQKSDKEMAILCNTFREKIRVVIFQLVIGFITEKKPVMSFADSNTGAYKVKTCRKNQ